MYNDAHQRPNRTFNTYRIELKLSRKTRAAMFSYMRLFTLLLSWCTASALAIPVWWMGAYNFRCKPPGYVEVTISDWDGEWRVSSICKPGTCCSNYAGTGKLLAGWQL